MRHATIQTRGRVTIPIEIRQALQLAEGDEVFFVQTEPGRFEIKAETRRAALLQRAPRRGALPAGPRRAGQLDLPI